MMTKLNQILILILFLPLVGCFESPFKSSSGSSTEQIQEEAPPVVVTEPPEDPLPTPMPNPTPTPQPTPGPTPSPGPTPNPTPGPTPTPKAFFIGYNEAWFGQNFQNSFTDGFNATEMNQTLSDIKSSGGTVVRVWLFQNRQGIILSGGAPRSSSIEPMMLTNLSKMMEMARVLNIKIYFTIWDGNVMPKDNSELRDYYYNLLNNKYGEGDAFNTYVLTPVLDLFSQNQDVIYALDLMNEIEAPINNKYWTSSWNGPRKWIQDSRNFVKSKAPWLRITSSAGWGWAAADIARGLFSGLGLDFYDLHVYDDNGNIMLASNVCSVAKKDGVPIILGEFGQATKNDDDNLQKTSTEKFLKNAKDSCFSGALAWRFDAAEETWRFQRADGSFRPAVDVMKNFK